MSFDIAAFDTITRSEQGVAFPVKHPKTLAPWLDEHGKPITITLLGRNSDAFRNQLRVSQALDASKAAAGITKSSEDFETERSDMLMALTKAWSFDVLDGKPFPCTPENIRKFWKDKRWPWLHTQMMENILTDGNFLAHSAPVSSGGQSVSFG